MIMYEYYETPLFGFSVLFLDYEYAPETAIELQHILENNGFFKDCYIQAGKLTHNRFVRLREDMREHFISAYTGACSVIQLCGAKNTTDTWNVNLTVFCPKTSQKPEQITKWNRVSLSVPYRLLKEALFCDRFFASFFQLLSLLKPFYATLDDLAVSSELSSYPGKGFIVPTRYGVVKAIHWGNYFSSAYCEKYKLSPQTHLPAAHMKSIGDGIYFSITESPLDYDTPRCMAQRKEIATMLNISLEQAMEGLHYFGLPGNGTVL